MGGVPYSNPGGPLLESPIFDSVQGMESCSFFCLCTGVQYISALVLQLQ